MHRQVSSRFPAYCGPIDDLLFADLRGSSLLLSSSSSIWQTVLLSATLTSKLRELAGKSLSSFEVLQLTAKGIEVADGLAEREPTSMDRAVTKEQKTDAEGGADDLNATRMSDHLDAPLQLQQSFVMLPSKHRLTGLVAFLRSRCQGMKECKVLVFLCSCDGVDFLFRHGTNLMSGKPSIICNHTDYK